MASPDGATDLAGGSFDLTSTDLSGVDGCASANLDACTLFGACKDSELITLTFDQAGHVSSIAAGDGGALPPAVQSCYQAFFQQHCYPSLAGTQQTIFPHCFIA